MMKEMEDGILNQKLILLSYAEEMESKGHLLASKYFIAIYKSMQLEEMFESLVRQANKEIIKHIKLENITNEEKIKDIFLELYDVWHPVRNAVETLDSIEEIRLYLKENPDYYTL